MGKRWRLTIVAVVILAALGAAFIGQDEGRDREEKAGAAAALPRLVDLGANTCIPCKRMAPILAELASEYAGRLVVEVIDIRQQPAASEEYGIRLIPTQIFYDAGGAELWRHEGFIDKASILAKWTELGLPLERSDGQG